tara:strand:+ start:7548 stop:9254 length:1707 start_codon:yes stop_codon:yes gene_type:complete
MPDVKQLVRDKEAEWQLMFDRMDIDANLHNNEPYVMLDEKGEKMPEVHHVTLPDAAIFSARVIAILMSSERQTVVRGDKMDDLRTTQIERFLDDFDYETDSFLLKRGRATHDAIQWERVSVRGHISTKCLVDVDGEKNLLPDIMPVDSRYFLYEHDNKDLAWAIPKYRRSKAWIEQEYGTQISAPFTWLWDYWDKNVNEIWIAGEKVGELENPYGYVPFITQAAPSGSMLEDEESIAHWGEGIFFIDRRLYPEKNRFGSIVATLTQKSFDHNLQYASDAGASADKPEQPEMDISGVFPIDKDGGYKAMPLNDTHNAARLWFSIIDGLLQKGSLSDINYGTLSFPLSAVAISNLTDAKDKILIPRLQAYALYKQQLARMIIKQFTDLKMKAWLGEDGHKREYDPKILEGNYSIGYRFFNTTKEQQVADASIANAMGDHVSEDYKLREVFRLQDPDGEKRKLKTERARRLNPVLELKDEAIALAYEGEFLNAEIVAANGVALLKQILGGTPNMETAGAMRRQGPSADVPALTEGGGGTRAPTSELQKDRVEGIAETTAQEKEVGRRENAF